jgi:hypothetical protein
MRIRKEAKYLNVSGFVRTTLHVLKWDRTLAKPFWRKIGTSTDSSLCASVYIREQGIFEFDEDHIFFGESSEGSTGTVWMH